MVRYYEGGRDVNMSELSVIRNRWSNAPAGPWKLIFIENKSIGRIGGPMGLLTSSELEIASHAREDVLSLLLAIESIPSLLSRIKELEELNRSWLNAYQYVEPIGPEISRSARKASRSERANVMTFWIWLATHTWFAIDKWRKA